MDPHEKYTIYIWPRLVMNNVSKGIKALERGGYNVFLRFLKSGNPQNGFPVYTFLLLA